VYVLSWLSLAQPNLFLDGLNPPRKTTRACVLWYQSTPVFFSLRIMLVRSQATTFIFYICLAFFFLLFTPVALPGPPTTLAFTYVTIVLALTNFPLSLACLVFPTLTTSHVYAISSITNGFIFYFKPNSR
jgi:hypothetical protein